MSRLSMAVALALGLALAQAAHADEFTTSRGVQQLPPVLSLTTEPALARASAQAEQVLVQLMRDIGDLNKQRRTVAADATGVAARVEADRAAIEVLRKDYEAADGKYGADLDSFQQHQSALEGEIQRQRAEAAALMARQEVDRPFSELQRMNTWATEIGNRRTALEAERMLLVQAREQVEAKRLKLVEAKRDAEDRLEKARKEITGSSGQLGDKQAGAVAQLRSAVAYLERVRSYYPLRLKKSAPASPILEQAMQLISSVDARPPAR